MITNLARFLFFGFIGNFSYKIFSFYVSGRIDPVNFSRPNFSKTQIIIFEVPDKSAIIYKELKSFDIRLKFER